MMDWWHDETPPFPGDVEEPFRLPLFRAGTLMGTDLFNRLVPAGVASNILPIGVLVEDYYPGDGPDVAIQMVSSMTHTPVRMEWLIS